MAQGALARHGAPPGNGTSRARNNAGQPSLNIPLGLRQLLLHISLEMSELPVDEPADEDRSWQGDQQRLKAPG